MAQKTVRTRPSRCKKLVVGGSTYSSAYDFSVTPEDLKKASRELNEKGDEKARYIRKLREKLEKDTDFQCRTDDDFLLCYLRFRKFDIDKTYKSIRKAQSIRMLHPEFFSLPPNLEELISKGILSLLPYRDEEGRIIHSHTLSKLKPEEVSFYELMQLIYVVSDVATMNPHSQINGCISIINFKGFNASVNYAAPLLNPYVLRNLTRSLCQDCNPERIKLILIVNCHGLVYTILCAVMFFMKKKIANRIKLIGSDLTEIHQYVNPALLPKELGGTLEEEECNITDYIMENVSFLEYIRSFETTSKSDLN